MQPRLTRLALTIFAFDAGIQAAIAAFYVIPRLDGAAAASLAIRLPLLLAEHALFAVALAALGVLAMRSRIASAIFLAAAGTVQAWLAVDMAVYRVFSRRFDPTMLEAGAPELWRLLTTRTWWLLRQQDALFIPALLSAVVLMVVLGRQLSRMRREPEAAASHDRLRGDQSRRRSPAVVAFGVYVLASMPVIGATESDLSRHPATALVAAALARPAMLVDAPEGYRIPPLLYGEADADPAVSNRIRAALASIHGAEARPSIVFVVLESVGARQLLKDGTPDPERAPFLAELARASIVFDSVYSPYPGSTRSHLAMMTGGRTLTTSDPWTHLPQRYGGPLVPRLLRSAGYQTALVAAADLQFEALDRFYAQAGFDTLVHAGMDGRPYTATDEISAWGVHEQAMRREVATWLDRREDGNRPFFLSLHTISTHHPYDAPPLADGTAAARRADDRARYLHALAYTDQVLRDVDQDLRNRGLGDNVVWVITGDHGQGFGDVHADDVGQLGSLYDELMRSFVIIAAPGRIDGPIHAGRIGSSGDIGPTLADLAGVAMEGVPGRSLLASDWTARLVFFEKLTPPATCGVRDGRWKFVGVRGGAGALFDLQADPDERQNQAAAHSARLAGYALACEQWIAATEREFLAQVSGPTGVAPVHYAGVPPGPQELFFGRFESGKPLARSKTFATGDRIIAVSHWSPYTRDHTILFRIRAPDGAARSVPARLRAGKTEALITIGIATRTGDWTVEVVHGERVVLESRYAVVPESASP